MQRRQPHDLSYMTYLLCCHFCRREKRMLLRSRSVWVGMLLLALLVPAQVCHADEQGLVVELVAPGSAAEKAGIQVGDSLLTYNGKPLRSSATFKALTENTFDKPAIFLVPQRGQEQQTLTVPTG